jgi:NADH-quinone oxidoreductase subunit A
VLQNYGYIGLFFIVALGFTLVMVLIPVILKRFKIVPSKPSETKGEPFECGVRTIGKTWVQFNFRYYFYALVFLAIDVMIVFLYPWAVSVKNLGGAGLATIGVLLLFVVIAYIYALKKKALEWK